MDTFSTTGRSLITGSPNKRVKLPLRLFCISLPNKSIVNGKATWLSKDPMMLSTPIHMWLPFNESWLRRLNRNGRLWISDSTAQLNEFKCREDFMIIPITEKPWSNKEGQSASRASKPLAFHNLLDWECGILRFDNAMGRHFLAYCYP